MPPLARFPIASGENGENMTGRDLAAILWPRSQDDVSTLGACLGKNSDSGSATIRFTFQS